jgi:hypothetical protein
LTDHERKVTYMAPPRTSNIDDTERARRRALRAKGQELYRAARAAGPDFTTDPAGALAFRAGCRSSWDAPFNVDTFHDLEAAQAAGMTWADIAVSVYGTDDPGVVARLRSTHAWRRRTMNTIEDGETPIEMQDLGDDHGGMPNI